MSSVYISMTFLSERTAIQPPETQSVVLSRRILPRPVLAHERDQVADELVL
jgi:hypothetical protein